jgi:hypothetical protein
MRVPEEPVCNDLFRQNPVFTSLHLKYPVHVVPPQGSLLMSPSSPFLGWFVGLVVLVQEIWSCLGCSSRLGKNIFYLTGRYFNSFVLITQQAGQAAVLGRLSLGVCLW